MSWPVYLAGCCDVDEFHVKISLESRSRSSLILITDYDEAIQKDSLVIPLLLWVSMNVLSVGVAAVLTAYGEVVSTDFSLLCSNFTVCRRNVVHVPLLNIS